jgi:hypothetical protein
VVVLSIAVAVVGLALTVALAFSSTSGIAWLFFLLTVVGSGIPWGAFYLTRWIARGFTRPVSEGKAETAQSITERQLPPVAFPPAPESRATDVAIPPVGPSLEAPLEGSSSAQTASPLFFEKEDDALKEVKQGAAAAIFVGCATTILSLLGAFGIEISPGQSLWNLVDAAIFLIIGWRISKHSRVAAVIGLVFFVAERAVQFISSGFQTVGIAVSLFIVLFLWRGVHGTFALARARPPRGAARASPLG